MKKTYKLQTHYKKILADTLSPVSIYLKIRDKFPNSMLLESRDYHGNDNSFSYICCNPIASIKIEGNTLTKTYPDQSKETSIIENNEVTNEIHQFTKQFKTQTKEKFKFINNGLFGYTSYDAVKYFETIELSEKEDSITIPELQYAVYQNIIAINHFKNEAYIFAHCYQSQSNIDELHHIICMDRFAVYGFETTNAIASNLTDGEFKEHVNIAKKHCQRGDVFQLVLSRKFQQEFKGDEFNVYRALRSINPSPYLFYFDYGAFKIFGSSPEAQLVVKNKSAEIHPIAGTFARSGDDMKDTALAQKLVDDVKENSEHVMLVDLARNDLSRHCSEVTVENYREIHGWLTGVGFPKNYEQFQVLQGAGTDRFPSTQNVGTSKELGEIKKATQDDGGLYSDATLMILTSKNNANLEVRFRNIYPTSLSGLSYDQQAGDTSYLTGSVVFSYLIYEFANINDPQTVESTT